MNVTNVGYRNGDSDRGDDKMEKSAIKEGKGGDIAKFY